jgi:hypothetical protein
MKSNKSSFVRGLFRGSLVPREYLISPLQVRMGAYTQFSNWMDDELRKLVARWGHLAPVRREAPRTTRP